MCPFIILYSRAAYLARRRWLRRGGENGTGFPYAGICVVKINKFHKKKLSGIENLLKTIDTVGKSCYHNIVKQPETLPERFPAKHVRERSTEYDVTIKDIARLSGVSVSTVSRVLNNRPDVSDENRRRVRAIIESSNYIPNNSARDLVRTKSDAIGLVVRGRSNPFYTDIIRAIEQGITERGYTMVMQQIGTSDDEVKRAAVMEREKRLRGLILLGGRSDYTPAEVALLNVPFVCCSYSNHYGTLRDEMYSSVSIEDEEEAYRAVMELYRRGHRRIAALVSRPDDRSISQLRYQGYARALADCGLPLEEELVLCAGSYDIRDAYDAARRALNAGADFTALFAIADNMAIGAMRALHETGRRIPEDCSVIAIDGLTVSEYIHPVLATLCQPMEEMGRRSVEILLDLVEGRGTQRHETLPTALREGASMRRL